MNNSSIHPIDIIERFLLSRREIGKVELSMYKYCPQTVEDERIIQKVTPSCLRSVFLQLREKMSINEEIAFHSRLYIGSGWNEQVMYLPFVDFKSELDDYALRKIAQVTRELECEEAYLVNSGRSFHLYALKLLTPDAWIRFMGRILLLNLPHKPELVDCRWVGHRLVAGYGALRWTKNTRQYIAEPRVVYEWHMDSFQPIAETAVSEILLR